MIKKLRNMDSSNDQNISITKFLFSQTAVKASEKNNSNNQTQQFIYIDEQSRRELINLIVKGVISEKSSPYSTYWTKDFLSLIEKNLPEFERYARSQVPLIKTKIADFNKVFGQEEKYDYEFFQSLYGLTSIDEILAKAEQSPPNLKQSVYQFAISQAISQGDMEKAQQLIDQKITDPSQRKQFMNQIDYQFMNQAASQGKVDEAKKIVSKIPSKDERISILAGLATSALANKDLKTAISLASEARNLIGAKAANPTQLQSLIQIAQIYSNINPQQSFLLYSSIIEQINRNLSAIIELDGFNPYGAIIKEGEIVLDESFYFSYIDQCAISLSELAKINFELAESAIKSFSPTEVKVKSKIRLAQFIL
jgi:hypothetical protein